MENYEPRKLLILRILDILTKYSDIDHKLKQEEIITLLKNDYGAECERKAVGRNIQSLRTAGYDIVSDKSGSYLRERKYEIGELRLLIDSVLSNRNICANHTKELIKKLSSEGGEYFNSHIKHIKNLDEWQKCKNQDYFYNIELLSEAIEKKRQVSFYYTTYGIDKKLHNKHLKPTVVNPYHLLLKNGRYYLMCNYDDFNDIVFCRIERINSLKILDEKSKVLSKIPGYQKDSALIRTCNSLPYLFNDQPEPIEFTVNINNIDLVIDWFGYDFLATKLDSDNVKISLLTGARALRYWLIQFGTQVTLTSPQHLIDSVKNDLTQILNKYNLL